MGTGTSEQSPGPRPTSRRRKLNPGIITYRNGQFTLPCVVREWSGESARIEYAGSVMPPAEFRLIVPGNGVEVECTMAWRHRHMMGLKFVGPVKPWTHEHRETIHAPPMMEPPSRLKPVELALSIG